MIKDPRINDMLSAYFDGEATPEECAEVERLRNTSPQVQRQLQEFERVSRLLGELPRESAPAEFPSDVLRLAERKMLLPDAPAPLHPARRSRTWLIVWGGAATTAAGLLVMAWSGR